MSTVYTTASDGVFLALRVTPKASHNEVNGIAVDGQGRAALKVRVTVAPEGGKANEAVIKLLAKAVGVAKTAIVVVGGESAREKRVHIQGNSQELIEKLAKLTRQDDK